MKKFLKEHAKALIALGVLLLVYVWYQGGPVMPKLEVISQNSGAYLMDMIPSAAPARDMKMAYEESYDYDDGEGDFATSNEDRKVITTANYSIEVEDPEETATEVRTYLNSIGGFLDNMEISEYRSNKKQAYLTMRVPSDKFEEATAKLKDYGYVQSENISSRDVTSEYYDNDEHIKNLEAREAKVREFFDKAEDVDQTLNVYRELASLREQIESLKGTQQNLDRQVDYSSIYLTLLPDIEINPISDNEWNVWKSFKKQVNSLVANLQGVADFLIFILVQAVIWLPIGLIIYFVWRKFKKRS